MCRLLQQSVFLQALHCLRNEVHFTNFRLDMCGLVQTESMLLDRYRAHAWDLVYKSNTVSGVCIIYVCLFCQDIIWVYGLMVPLLPLSAVQSFPSHCSWNFALFYFGNFASPWVLVFDPAIHVSATPENFAETSLRTMGRETLYISLSLPLFVNIRPHIGNEQLLTCFMSVLPQKGGNMRIPVIMTLTYPELTVCYNNS